MGQITVIFEAERRRRWSQEERLQILTEAFSPGACVADVARRHDVSTGLIYTWRRKLREANAEPVPEALPGPGFVQAVMVEEEGTAPAGIHPAMVVDLARGKRVTIFATASPGQVTAALKALRLSARACGCGSRWATPTCGRGCRAWRCWSSKASAHPHGGDLFVFRGRAGSLVKIIWHDGIGISLYAKRLERGRFVWPSARAGIVSLTSSQLACLLEGIDRPVDYRYVAGFSSLVC